MYLDFDFGRQVVNLTPHDKNKEKQMQSLVTTGFDASKDTLIAGDYKNGFLVTDYFNVEAGVGPAVKYWYENASGVKENLSAVIGLIPFAGKSGVATRFAATREEVGNMSGVKLPRTSADVAKMSVGDSIAVTKQGGAIFFVGAAYHGVGFGTNVLKRGTFEQFVQKVNDRQVLVRITDGSIKSNSYNTGAGFVSFAVGGSLTQKSNGRSYLVDLGVDAGRKAFEDLINGNEAGVARAIQNKVVNGVERYENIVSTTVNAGRNRTLFIGIPNLLNVTWASGKTYTLTNTDMFYNGMSSKVEYGVYTKDVRTKILNTHKEKTSAFYGTVYSMKDQKTSEITNGHFGQMVLNAQNESSDSGNVQVMIAEIARKTGLSKQMKVNIPTMDKMGFENVSFRMTLDNDQSIRLTKAADAASEESMVKYAKALISGYFTQGDRDDVCADYYIGMGAKESKEDILKECTRRVTAATVSAVKEMKNSLGWLRYYRTKNQQKDMALAYANFGKAVMANQFALKTALGLAGAGVQMEYSIRGAAVSGYTVNMESTSNPNVVSVTKTASQQAVTPSNAKGLTHKGVIIVPGQGPNVVMPVSQK